MSANARAARALTQEIDAYIAQDKVFRVRGTTGKCYHVFMSEEPTCTCPDFRYRHRIRCKHIYYVLLKILHILVGYKDPVLEERLLRRKLREARAKIEHIVRCTIVGMRFYSTSVNIVRGMRLFLRPEPNNAHDSHAIVVFGPNRRKQGYVSRDTQVGVGRLPADGKWFRVYGEPLQCGLNAVHLYLASI